MEGIVASLFTGVAIASVAVVTAGYKGWLGKSRKKIGTSSHAQPQVNNTSLQSTSVHQHTPDISEVPTPPLIADKSQSSITPIPEIISTGFHMSDTRAEQLVEEIIVTKSVDNHQSSIVHESMPESPREKFIASEASSIQEVIPHTPLAPKKPRGRRKASAAQSNRRKRKSPQTTESTEPTYIH